jgi:ribosomal protein S18 acetylase RimI-like enzyme
VRPLRLEDAASAAQLVRDYEEQVFGRPSRVEENDLVSWWQRLELERDTWAYERGGELVAFGGYELHGPVGLVLGVVRPAAQGRGLGSEIASLAERRLAQKGAARLHAPVYAADEAGARLFGGRGYREARRFWDMAIELEEAPLVPALAPPLVLEPYREEDAHAFYDAMVESFADHWDWHAGPFEEWLELRRGQHADEHGPLWFVVRDGDELAAVVRNEANRNGGGFVGLLGVRRAWRGRGLGKALLYRTFAEFWRRGVTRVTLGVDAESPTGATKLYESVGMRVELESVVFEKAAGLDSSSADD